MLEKGEQKQIKPQHKRKEKINIYIELNKVKNNNNNNLNETHSCCFRKKFNGIDKVLTRLTQKKREDTNYRIRNKTEASLQIL